MRSQNKLQNLPHIQLRRDEEQCVEGNTEGLTTERTAKAVSWRPSTCSRVRTRTQQQSTHGSIIHITECANEGEKVTTE